MPAAPGPARFFTPTGPVIQASQNPGVPVMNDVIFLLLGLGGFGLMAAYVRLCTRL